MKALVLKLRDLKTSLVLGCIFVISTPSFAFDVAFDLSSDPALEIEAIISYSPTTSSQWGEYGYCRSRNYSRSMKFKKDTNILRFKDSIPLVIKKGNCEAEFQAIQIMIRENNKNDSMISFVKSANSSLPERLSVSCLNGIIKRNTNYSGHDQLWLPSYVAFNCESAQSMDSLKRSFNFDPSKPFDLKNVEITFAKQVAPDFSGVVVSEVHGAVEFKYSKNNVGLVGANSPVQVIGFEGLEGKLFFITSLSFTNATHTRPYIRAESRDGKGPVFEIVNPDIYDNCNSERVLKVWKTPQSMQEVYCL